MPIDFTNPIPATQSPHRHGMSGFPRPGRSLDKGFFYFRHKGVLR